MSCKFCFIENLADRSVALDHAFFCSSLERVFSYVRSEKGFHVVMGRPFPLACFGVEVFSLFRVGKFFTDHNVLKSSYDAIPVGYLVVGSSHSLLRKNFDNFMKENSAV